MPQQTIRINVPEGYEVVLVSQSTLHPNKDGMDMPILVSLKKEAPKYIEVRDYLLKLYSGTIIHGSAQKSISDIKMIEKGNNFLRWVDQDWRKVEI